MEKLKNSSEKLSEKPKKSKGPRPPKTWKPRLPIEHPEYQYPTSKNPYNQKIEVLRQSASGAFLTCVALDHESERYRSQWLNFFPKKSIHLEIGCNAGHVLLEWAEKNPDRQYVGIDWKYKTIYRAAEKAVKRNIQNVVFLRAHAERLDLMFAPQELDEICLYFPDPWPKKAHWKNRFVNTKRLQMVHSLLKRGGTFHIKTDHPEYFEWMLNALEPVKNDWEVLSMSRNLHEGHPSPDRLQIPEVTLFEKIFIRDQIPIQSIRLKAL